ncbi:hypothetical protein HS088_TW01G00206 [Tripterygium wilfordii]|uniref:Uncharacterized protein n=1 Tax=Tripterygium wilfordii TaxID=458696 RepID=A0A7J7E116_TRIWF|nr:uncharacterized protein LOC120001849 [Tripterygium wilfordii]KAF5752298.1 hypothetical protein HS088_TW01G00206 [Tripterygium wilfordii]
MEVTMEAEDGLFFADLSKQISLLIMDDDDDEDPVARCSSVSFQAFSRANYAATASPIFQEQTLLYRRESKGTGVFIPQSLHPRRKQNRQGRFSSLNSSKSQKQQLQLDNNTRFVSQASYNNNNSFHLKKGLN